MHKNIFISLIVVLLLYGCNTSSKNDENGLLQDPYPGPNNFQDPLLHTPESYPGPGGPVNQSEIPMTQLIDPLEIPTPSTQNGIVTGKIVTISDGKEFPFITTLYLAETIQANQPGSPPLISFSENASPKSMQDSSGKFVFVNVPPGEYALLIWSPGGNVIIDDPLTNQTLIISVEAGQIYEIENLVIP